MTKIYLGFFILLIFASCQPKIESRICTYTEYRFYRLFKDDLKIDRLSFQSIKIEKMEDSLILYRSIEDSIYLSLYDTIELTKYSNELRIHINKDSLPLSYAKRGNYSNDGNFVLTLLKKHRIDNKVYEIYRFDHDFDGDDGRYAIFYTEEFGVIMEFGYDKGGLSKLTEIRNSENHDYKILTKKMLNDSVFLFTPWSDI